MTRIESGALISANIRLRRQLYLAKEALAFYQSQNHFDVEQGKIKLLDNGDIAAEALQAIQDVETN